MSNYTNGLSVQATPTRDRDRLPFPHSSQPSPAPSLRQTSSSSASTSLTNLNSVTTTTSSSSAQVSPQTVSSDSLLKQFASSADPHAAALDQAVADRNVLSAQNAQLWKLIEKQRTGYNQILKELERIRGERDTYKGRLAALTANGPNGIPDTRQKTTSERGSRPSLDTTSSYASVSSASPVQTRQPIVRHNSNDNGKSSKILQVLLVSLIPAKLPQNRSTILQTFNHRALLTPHLTGRLIMFQLILPRQREYPAHYQYLLPRHLQADRNLLLHL